MLNEAQTLLSVCVTNKVLLFNTVGFMLCLFAFHDLLFKKILTFINVALMHLSSGTFRLSQDPRTQTWGLSNSGQLHK